MSGKKQKLLRKYLNKRDATDKIELSTFDTRTGKRIVRHSIKREIKNSYTNASKRGKTLLTGFFKEIINHTLNESNKK